MVKNKLLFAFLLVLASFFIHLYLMNTHYDFVFGLSEQKSVCSINQKLDCESVSISPYAYLLGIPVATWGTSFHFVFLILFAFVLFYSEKKDSLKRWLRLFASVSLLASLAMAIISFTLMKTYCVFCITLYVLSLANFLLLASQKEKPFFPTINDSKWYPLWIAILLIPAGAWVSDSMNKQGALEKLSGITQDSLNTWQNAPVSTQFAAPILTEGASEHDAKMTISEFADFECIHCRDSAHGLHSFVASKPDVRFQFFAFPLDGSCNPKMANGISNDGKHCQLARAVYCAEKQGKGWKAHEWIFDRFGTDENSNFGKLIEDLKLDPNLFHTCLASDEAFHYIEQNAMLADQLHVDSTPTIFVNGKLLLGGNTIFVLESLYKKLHL